MAPSICYTCGKCNPSNINGTEMVWFCKDPMEPEQGYERFVVCGQCIDILKRKDQKLHVFEYGGQYPINQYIGHLVQTPKGRWCYKIEILYGELENSGDEWSWNDANKMLWHKERK